MDSVLDQRFQTGTNSALDRTNSTTYRESHCFEWGNEYREGRDNGVIRPYNSEDRRIRYRKNMKPDDDDID